MYQEFKLNGELKKLNSYPEWAVELVNFVNIAKQKITQHELFQMMRDARLSESATAAFLIRTWPVIEQFPRYMALNLLKTVSGRSAGEDMARSFLIRNIRVEQHHADYWLDWAAAHGISKEKIFSGHIPVENQSLYHWCMYSCTVDSLAESMAATNFAIEGATGEWTSLICSSDAYANSFAEAERERAMTWLRAHADYDDTHPWEALEIICTLVGLRPNLKQVASLRQSILNSYAYMVMSCDCSLAAS